MQASRPDGHPSESAPDIRTRLRHGTQVLLDVLGAGDDGGGHT